MTGLRLVVGFLLVFNVATALGIVYNKHESRMLFKSMRTIQEGIDQANIEWGRLQIEESTLARFGRIEEIASSRLGMHMPEHGEIKTVLK
ncbi:cell division protein FtsL [Chromatiales bacterium (ex Bugula neritina AB1)]|nr:cell division protein FtsL [Chromatiales bacterium (ex Bugula neritina AB1)]